MVGSDEKGRLSSTAIKGLPWHTNANQRKQFHTEHNQEGEPPRVLITGT